MRGVIHSQSGKATNIRQSKTVSRNAWLAKETVFTKERDVLPQERQALPRVKIDKNYIFDWEEGCSSCSFWADNYDGVATHLNARDINMVTVSSAPLGTLLDDKARMGWSFDWVSSQGNDFKAYFDVTFEQSDTPPDTPNYNFRTLTFGGTEAAGLSVFEKDADGTLFHTYSTCSRGLDMFNRAYHLMDATPFSMSWARRHDSYTAPHE